MLKDHGSPFPSPTKCKPLFHIIPTPFPLAKAPEPMPVALPFVQNWTGDVLVDQFMK